jgi:hypothetical protein
MRLLSHSMVQEVLRKTKGKKMTTSEKNSLEVCSCHGQTNHSDHFESRFVAECRCFEGVRQNQVSSSILYIQLIPGSGAWPDLRDGFHFFVSLYVNCMNLYSTRYQVSSTLDSTLNISFIIHTDRKRFQIPGLESQMLGLRSYNTFMYNTLRLYCIQQYST